MSQPVCDAMLQLVRVVIKHNVVIDDVVHVCDFLLLMHPATASYVPQNRRAFYFHNKWSQ